MGDTFFMRLYTKEFLADSKVRALSREHRADLVDLWCHCDQEGSIPADAVAVGRLLGLTPAAARRTMEALCAFFREDSDQPGRLFSPRHRRERAAREAEAEGHRRGAETTNRKRWGNRPEGEAPSESLGDRSATDKRLAEGSPVISQQSVVQPAVAGCGAQLPAAPAAPQPAKARANRRGKVQPLQTQPLEVLLGGKGSQTWDRYWRTMGVWPREKNPAPKRTAMAWLEACKRQAPADIYRAALHYRDEFLPPRRKADETQFMRSPLEWLEQEGWLTELQALEAKEVSHG